MLDYLNVLQLVKIKEQTTQEDKEKERNANAAGTVGETTSNESTIVVIGENTQPSSPPNELSEVQFEAECGLPLCTPCRMAPKYQDREFEYGNGHSVLNITPQDEGNSAHANLTFPSVGITQDNFPNASRNITKIYKKGRRSSNGCYRRRCAKCCVLRFALVFLWVIAAILWGYIIISKMPNYQFYQLFGKY